MRHLFGRHRAIAAAIVLCALLVRLIVPAGYMPVVAQDGIAVVVCPAAAPTPRVTAPPVHHGEAEMSHGDAEGEPVQMPCAFSGLGLTALDRADPELLVAALAFAFLPDARAVLPLPPALPARLRPPLRAPPVA